MRKRRLAAASVALCLLLSGCAADAEGSAIDECSQLGVMAKYRDDPMPAESVKVSDVLSVQVDPDDPVFTITGTTVVKYPNGSADSVDWSCFAQVVDGKTYADIQRAVVASTGRVSTD
jgi:hypothetical protein